MFLDFFYLLRARGLNISLNEWMVLMEALEKGLHQNSLTGFYYLSRAVLIKSETDFDRYDQIFYEFFKNVPFEGELPRELMDWLNHPSEHMMQDIEKLRQMGFPEEDLQDLLAKLKERIAEQDSEHNGGNRWVGTQGTSPFGNNGWHPNGLRVGGESHHKTAMKVIGERKYRDFRKDNTLDTRQFQMAFRTLRQLSSQNDSSETVLDLDGTISDTADNAGLLKIRYRKARKNNIKVLLLMDSGGSMQFYADLCNMLFQAATKANNFKELHTFYFHNCIQSEIYTTPAIWGNDKAETEWLLQNFDSSYKVIIVGDARMSPYELNDPEYHWRTREHTASGLEWFLRFKNKYPYLIWMNPEPMPEYKDYWNQTHVQLGKIFNMFELTSEGLEQGMKYLMAKR